MEIFNNGNQNSFYIELTKTDDYYRECKDNQASFTIGNGKGGLVVLAFAVVIVGLCNLNLK
jgi:hypothetical protein